MKRAVIQLQPGRQSLLTWGGTHLKAGERASVEWPVWEQIRDCGDPVDLLREIPDDDELRETAEREAMAKAEADAEVELQYMAMKNEELDRKHAVQADSAMPEEPIVEEEDAKDDLDVKEFAPVVSEVAQEVEPEPAVVHEPEPEAVEIPSPKQPKKGKRRRK